MVRALKELLNSRKPLTKTSVSLISVYSSQQGIVLATQQFETKTTSELTVVQNLLAALHLEEVVFTLDALHTQKKLH